MPEDAPLTLADVPATDLTDEPFRTNPAAAFDALRQQTWIIRADTKYWTDLFRGAEVPVVPLGPHMARIDAAITGPREYFRELVAHRHRQPGEDFVSTLIAAQKETGRLTEDELHGALLNLLFAGQDTTRYQFGWVVQLLLEHEAWERLDATPDRVPRAIEEAMRLEPTLHILLRKVVADVEYRGLVLPAGTLMAVNTYAVNRDPAAFPDPHRFDVMPANAHRHLGFGHGGHLCLGHGLARAEMAEALTLFVERLPGLQSAGEPGGVTGFSSMTGAERIPLANRQQRPGRSRRLPAEALTSVPCASRKVWGDPASRVPPLVVRRVNHPRTESKSSTREIEGLAHQG